jgi:hypothetical protein
MGVVLAHDDDAAGWQSELMNTVALVRSHHELSSNAGDVATSATSAPQETVAHGPIAAFSDCRLLPG